MNLLRLRWRLARGAGSRELWRMVAVSVGIALAVLTALVAIAVLRQFAYREAVLSSRVPVGSQQESVHGLHVASVGEQVDGREATIVTVSGVDSTSRRPPGVSAWPSVGDSLVSPAVLAPSSLTLRQGLHVAGTVQPAGMISPDELLVYTVVPTAGTDTVVTGFGSSRPVDGPSSQLTWVLVEVLLLVGCPATLFMGTGLRLMALGHQERDWALHLLGVGPATRRRLRAIDMVVMAGIGVVVGLAVYASIQGRLGTSGVLGVSWFATTGRVTALVVAGVIALVGLVCWASGRALPVSGAPRPSQRDAGRRGPVTQVAALVFMVVALIAVGAMVVWWLRPPAENLDDRIGAYPYAALLVLVGTTPGVARVLTDVVSGWLSHRSRRVAWRLGGQQAHHQARRVAALGASLSIMVFGLAFGQAFLVMLKEAAVGNLGTASAQVSLKGLSPAQRASLSTVGGDPVVDETIHPSSDKYYDVAFVGCAGSGNAANQCSGLPTGDGELPAGTTLHLPLTGHRTMSIRVPSRQVSDSANVARLALHEDTWAWDLSDACVTWTASVLNSDFDTLLAALRSAVPANDIQAGIANPDAWIVYQQQRTVWNTCVAMGGLLILVATVMTLAEIRWAHRRSDVSLVALGTPPHVLRVSTAVRFLVPTLPTAATAGITGFVTGAVFVLLTCGKPALAITWPTLLGWSTIPALGAALITGTVGLLLPVPAFDRKLVASV